MIENIRKYTGLMIVVLVLLFIGLVFLESSASNLTSGAPAMEVAGRKISQKEFARHSTNTLQVPSRMGQSMIPQEAQQNPLTSLLFNPFTFTSQQLLGNVNTTLAEDSPERFLANRIAIQKAGLEYGATPGPAEVESFIEYVLFADADGGFDQVAYDDFIKERIGSLGIGTRGFNEYIRDLLTAGNLATIISGDIEPDSKVVEALYRNRKQVINAQQISLESSKYMPAQEPTEEEIKEYWEGHQDKYNTDERRKISYVMFEPDWEQALLDAEKAKAEAEKAKKAQEEAAAKLKEEAKKAEEAAQKANEENTESKATPPSPAETPEGAQGTIGAQGDPAPITPATPAVETPAAPSAPPVTIAEKPAAKPELPKLSAKDKLTLAQKTAAVNGLSEKVNDFYAALVDASGTTLEQIAEQKKIKIITTELFSKLDPPKELSERATNSQIGTLADIVFRISPEAKNDQRITDPYTTSDGWFIGRVDEIEASRPLTFEEAKVKATVDLKTEMARRQLAEESVTIREKVAALVAGGKSFEEAAKELSLTFQKLPDLRIPERAQFVPPAFDAARYTDPGTIAEIKFIPNTESPERALIVFVEKREVTVDQAYKDGLENEMESRKSITRLIVFLNWLRDRYTENEVQYFLKEDNR